MMFKHNYSMIFFSLVLLYFGYKKLMPKYIFFIGFLLLVN
jgi:hypothetical protein